MQRPFSTYEVEEIRDYHNSISRLLNEIVESSVDYYNDIKETSDTIAAKEVIKILSKVPVEELNHDRKGIRVKALHDGGYNTIADLAVDSVYSISSVYGISEDAAFTIKRITDDFVSKTRRGVKIRISTDYKTADYNKLIKTIYQYKRCEPIANDCKKVIDFYEKDIQMAKADLETAQSGLRWFFSSKEKKQKAIDAYNYLNNLKIGKYGAYCEARRNKYKQIPHPSAEVAWKEFESDSITYINILEYVNPGILGNDDLRYGLPEDLAREIQDECFFPDGLLCDLRRYQVWGVKYILHQGRVLLGDEMGLGKTVQAIASMVSLKNTGANHFMVICPASVLTNWCREIRKMSKLSVIKIHGTGRKAAFQQWLKTGGVAVTTYETTGFCKIPEEFKFTQLVVDEAHYIKNPSARRTENVKEISKHAERLLFMTGTALENKVDEMISLIKILNPRIASIVSKIAFISSAPQFRKEVAPVYYRRKREDVLTELPELIESKEWCTLGRVEEAEYETAILSGSYSDARRVSWNVNDLKHSSKASRLVELVEEAEEDGRKVIIFSFFLDTIRKVTMLLGNRCTNPITGSVNPRRRQEIIDEFDKAPAGSVLVAQIQSGGTGLNIQSASVVVICEPQFKPSIENQAISRAYRMGQTRNVLVYRLLCENTVDEKITDLLESKQKIFDAFADRSEAAEKTVELDDRSFGDIIKEEIDRINAKRGNTQ